MTNPKKLEPCKIKWIDDATSKFKTVSTSTDNQKFQMLPKWLDTVSHRYVKEFHKYFPRSLPYFKYGAIVRADFGVNMGSEFCGLHFAIVLNKHDNSKNGTLTVLPLTSHDKNGRFPLGTEIFNQTTQNIKLQIDSLENRLNKLTEETDIEVKIQKSLKYSISHPSSSHEPIDDSIKELEKMTVATGKNICELKKDINRLERVNEVYDRYNKSSYVRLNDITTISKYRLRYINKYDPSGKILLTSQQMSDISLSIQKLYLSDPKLNPITKH